MEKNELHAMVLVLWVGDKQRMRRALVHALIDLDQVTHFNCTWEHCVLPNQPLTPSGRFRDSVTFDHTIAKTDGGDDHWQNITLMHHTCNMRKGAEFTQERRAKIGEKLRERWQDPTFREETIKKVAKAINADGMRERKSEAMKRHWADPERKAAHTAKLARGDAWKKGRS